MTAIDQTIIRLRNNGDGSYQVLSDTVRPQLGDMRMAFPVLQDTVNNLGIYKLPNSVLPSGITRSLDTVFQISDSKPVLAIYTIELEVSYHLLSSQEVSVKLFSDVSIQPTVQQGEVYLYGNQGVGLSVTNIVKNRQILIAWIQPGHYVQLTTSGAGIATLINQLELIYG